MSDPSHPGAEAPENSWATGTAPEVNSVYQRLVEVRPETEGHVANRAVNGAKAATLASQAVDALSAVPAPELVLIQTIDNDIRCDGTDQAHLEDFGASVADALNVIVDASPDSRILLVSIVGRPATYAAAVATKPAVAASMGGTGMCDFFDPAGNLNQEHLVTLTGIVESYEAEQERVCALVPQCSGDDGALASLVDDISDLVPGDWNHLTAHGHARVAETMWPTVAQLLGVS